MGLVEISCGWRPALSRQCAGTAAAAQYGGAARARDQDPMGRGHVAAWLFAAAGRHDGRKMGQGRLARFQAKHALGLDPGAEPVRVKKTRQIKNREPRSESIEAE